MSYATALFVASCLLLSAFAQSGPGPRPEQIAFGRFANPPPLKSARSPTIFFDVTVTATIRVTRVGAYMATGSVVTVPTINLFVRNGTSRGFETLPLNTSFWTQITSDAGVLGTAIGGQSITFAAVPGFRGQNTSTLPATGTGANTNNVYLFDVPDFVLVAGVTYGFALADQHGTNFIYEAALHNQTYLASGFFGSATQSGAANFTLTSMVENFVGSDTSQLRKRSESTFNDPEVVIEFAEAFGLNLADVPNPPVVQTVVAGSNGGVNNLVFNAQVCNPNTGNLDFAAQGVDIHEQLTFGAGVSVASHSASTVTGCTWVVQTFPVLNNATGGPQDITTDEAILSGPANQTFHFTTLNFGDEDQGQVACGPDVPEAVFGVDCAPFDFNNHVAGDESFNVTNLVLQAQTSFVQPANYQLAFYSESGSFNKSDVFVYLGNTTGGTGDGEQTFIASTTEPGFFYTASHAAIGAGAGSVIDIRVVLISPGAANNSHPDFEFYIHYNSTNTFTHLDQSFALLAPSQVSANVTYAPANADQSQGDFIIPSLCVGGCVTLTTTLNVGATAPIQLITQNLTVANISEQRKRQVVVIGGDLVQVSPSVQSAQVVENFTIVVSKTSFCDQSLTEGWTVAMYQSDEATLVNGSSPFITFNNLLASGAVPTVVGGPFDVVNFADPFHAGGGAANVPANTESCYPLNAACATSNTTALNNFFFRAVGNIQISVAGFYTIATVENRGARVIVDGNTLYQTEPFQTGTLEDFYTLHLSAGVHNVIVDHYDTLGTSRLQLFIATGVEPQQNTSSASPSTPSLISGNTALTYHLLTTVPACQQPCDNSLFSGYNVQMWQSSAVAITDSQSPFQTIAEFVANGTTPTVAQCGVQFINFINSNANVTQANEFGNGTTYPLGAEATNFLFFASGQFFIGVAGNYTIVAETDRGVQVSIDGVPTIDSHPIADGFVVPTPYVSLPLTTGLHTITIAHYASVGNQTIGDAQISIGIAPGSIRTIPGNPGVTDVLSQLNFTLLGTALDCQLPGAERIVAGQNFTFTLDLTNEGPSEATDINVLDLLRQFASIGGNANATLIDVRSSTLTDFATPANNVSSNLTAIDILPGETRRFFFDASVPSDAAVNSTVCNNASIDGVVAMETLFNAGLSSSNVSVCDTVVRLVDLAITQTQSSPTSSQVLFNGLPEHTIVAGDTLPASNVSSGTEIFTVTATNEGPSNTAGFTIFDTLTVPTQGVTVTVSPTSVTNVTVESGPNNSTTTYTFKWSPPATAVGQSRVMRITVVADHTAVGGGFITNVVNPVPTLSPGEIFYDTYVNGPQFPCTNQVPTLDTTIIREFDLAVNKTETFGPTPAIAGLNGTQTVGYTVTVTNLGPSDATNVDLVDTLIANGFDIFNGQAAPGVTVNGSTTSNGTFNSGAPLCSNPNAPGAGWTVQVFQSNASTVVNGTSPSFDLDSILASGVQPNATSVVQFINFVDLTNHVDPQDPATELFNGSVAFPFPENHTDFFYAYITGTISVFTTGFYTFGIRTNRGVRVEIFNANGSELVSTPFQFEPPHHGTFDNFDVVSLDAATYQVAVSFYDTRGAGSGQTSILQLLYAPQAIAQPFTNPPFTLDNYNFLPTSGACLFQCNAGLAGTANWTIQMWSVNSTVITGGPGFASPYDTLDKLFIDNPANPPTVTDETHNVLNFNAGGVDNSSDLFTGAGPYPLNTSTPFLFNARTVFFVPTAGLYTIGATAELGVRVIVDGQLLIRQEPVIGRTSTTEGDLRNNFFELPLAAGAHFIEVAHYALNNTATLQVYYTPVVNNFNLDQDSEPTTNASFALLPGAPLCELPVFSTGPLPVGATVSFTLNVTVDHSAAVGELFNDIDYAVATTPFEFVIDTNDDENAATVIIPIQRNVNISIVKAQVVPALNAPVVAGSNNNSVNLVYQITVHNFGSSDTSGVDVDELFHLPLSDNVQGPFYVLSDNSSTANVDTTTTPNVWHTGLIVAGSSVTLNVSFAVGCQAQGQCAAGNNSIINSASLGSLTDPNEHLIDVVPSSNVTTQIIRQSDVTVVVTRAAANVTANGTDEGGAIGFAGNCETFTVAVRNHGPSAISAASVSNVFTLPLGVSIRNVTFHTVAGRATSVGAVGSALLLGFGPLDCGNCSDAATLVPNDVFATPDGCSSAAQILVCSDSSTVTTTAASDTASYVPNTPCENVINTGDDSSTTGGASTGTLVGIVLTKSASPAAPATVTAGSGTGNLIFTVTATNNGPSDATNVVIQEALSGSDSGNVTVFLVEPGTTDQGWQVQTFVNTNNNNTVSIAAAQALATGTPFSTETFDTLDVSGFATSHLNPIVNVQDLALLATTQVFLTQVGRQNYTFAVTASDGAQLSVDGTPIITVDGLNPTPVTKAATIALLPGAHVVQVLYYNHNGTQQLHVYLANGVQTAAATAQPANLLRGSRTNSYAPANSANGQWTIPVLRVGHNTTLLAIYTVGQSAVDGGQVNDTASLASVDQIQSPATTNAGAFATVVRECNRTFIHVVNTTTNVVQVVAGSGVQVVHTFTLTNTGPSECDGVRVDFDSNANQVTGVTTVNSTTEFFHITTNIGSEAQQVFTVVYNVNSSAPAGGDLETTVVLDDQALTDPTNSLRKRAPIGGTAVHEHTIIVRQAGLSITKTADADLIGLDQNVTYTIVVANNGPSDTNNLTVVDHCSTPTGVSESGCTTRTLTSNTVLAAGASETFTVSINGTASGFSAINNFATANGINGTFETTLSASTANVPTSVAPLEPSLTFSAFRTRNSWEDSDSDSDDDDGEHCTVHDHSAEKCTRLFFVELANTDANVRADNVVVHVGVTNVALAEALLTQSSRDDDVHNNGHGEFTWTIPSLQPGARARIALKVRVTHSNQQVTANVESADACLPRATAAECALFPVASVAGPTGKPYTLSKVF